MNSINLQRSSNQCNVLFTIHHTVLWTTVEQYCAPYLEDKVADEDGDEDVDPFGLLSITNSTAGIQAGHACHKLGTKTKS